MIIVRRDLLYYTIIINYYYNNILPGIIIIIIIYFFVVVIITTTATINQHYIRAAGLHCLYKVLLHKYHFDIIVASSIVKEDFCILFWNWPIKSKST
jgi:hypothetical protein